MNNILGGEEEGKKEDLNPLIYWNDKEREEILSELKKGQLPLWRILDMCRNDLQRNFVLGKSDLKTDKDLAIELIRQGHARLLLSCNKWFIWLDFEILMAILESVEMDTDIVKFPYLTDIIDFCVKYWIQWNEFSEAFVKWVVLWWDMFINLDTIFHRLNEEKILQDVNFPVLFFAMFNRPNQVYSLVYQEQLHLFPSDFIEKIIKILESKPERKKFMDKYIATQEEESMINKATFSKHKARIDAMFACLKDMLGLEETQGWASISENKYLLVFNELSAVLTS